MKHLKKLSTMATATGLGALLATIISNSKKKTKRKMHLSL